MATQTANQKLQGLLNSTEGLRANSGRDDYGRTVWDYSITERTPEGKYVRSDHAVVVNMPRTWIEAKGTKYMVNTAPGHYATGEVRDFTGRADAHLFAVEELLARFNGGK